MPQVPLAFAASGLAAVAGACFARVGARSLARTARQRADAARSGSDAERKLPPPLAYACTIERGKGASTHPNARSARTTASSERMTTRIRRAGLDGHVGVSSCREASLRIGLAGCAIGAVVGSLFSLELAAMLALVGAFLGGRSVVRSLDRAHDQRLASLARELPEMLEVTSLGLRSGLTFERSFALYHEHFPAAFARECASAHREWRLGLATREEALRSLADSYDAPLLNCVVESIVRSLRLGTSLAEALESQAAEARSARLAKREEEAARAPVKMMVPTGALILPAMLLLVLGPVLLELAQGM